MSCEKCAELERRLDAIRNVLSGDWGINVSSALERVQNILDPSVRPCRQAYKPPGKAIVRTCVLPRNHDGDHSDIVVERRFPKSRDECPGMFCGLNASGNDCDDPDCQFKHPGRADA